MKTKDIFYTLPVLLLPALVLLAGPRDPAWVRMWSLAFACYFGCKILTLSELPPKTPFRSLGIYLLLWPGMDPAAFLQTHLLQPEPSARTHLLRTGLRNMLLGLVWLLVFPRMLRDTQDFWAAWSCMVGMIHLLHFGLFHLLAGFWQGRGYGAEPLMINPAAARSPGDFWGRRWNRAFHLLTRRYLYTPIRRRLNAPVALGLSFLISGLIHELVITLPARGGYGGPTVYFLLQGAGMMLDRETFIRTHPGFRRTFTLLLVLAPVPLLFPPVFVHNVALPMFRAWGIL